MKISIDEEACIGCGMCESLCGKCFKLEGGKAKVVNEESCNECDIEEVADNCPTDAIKIKK